MDAALGAALLTVVTVSAGLPLVMLMIGYTVLSLWIIAQPITREPGTSSAALLR